MINDSQRSQSIWWEPLFLPLLYTNCFLLPKGCEARCSFAFVGLSHRWKLSVVPQWFLLWAFYRLWSSPAHCTGRVEVSHLTSLCVSVCGEPTKTRPPGSKPTLQAQRFWRLVLDHLKSPVNKAESFRYKPSESAALQRSTDSLKYHCWQYRGMKRKTSWSLFISLPPVLLRSTHSC